MTSGLVEWLTKILDEDEALARHVGIEHGSGWYGGGGSVGSAESMYIAVGPWSGELDAETTTFIAKSGPSAVLADIAAKRAILGIYRDFLEGPMPTSAWESGQLKAIAKAVSHIASAYADRDGYREEWRP